MKITVAQLKTIKPGSKITYKCDHPKELQNIRQAASYTCLTYPELGIRFKSTLNRAKSEITLEAVPVEQPKKQKRRKA